MAGGYIPRKGLDALNNYKYKSGEYSWLDNRLNNFWFWCAEQLPRWMAPNVVTMIGTTHLFVIAVLAQLFDPTLEGKSPSWVYLVNAWCLFVYQTMDAADGKQARRTGSSSPLGQLFDHGCDSLGTTFIAIGLCSLMGFGGHWQTVSVLATVQIPFYLCQWEENHVHVLRAQVGNFGVTEGQYLSIVLNIATAVFGSHIWKRTVAGTLAAFGMGALPLPSLVGDLVVGDVSVVVGAVFPAILALSTVLSVARLTTNFARALLLTAPLWLQQGLQICIQRHQPARDLFLANPVPFIVVQGVLLSHLANRIIVASVCHLEFPLVHYVLFPAPFFIYYIMNLEQEGVKPTDSEVTTLTAALAIYGVAIIAQFLHFVHSVVDVITRHLGIYCFTLKKRPGAAAKRNTQ